MFKKALIVLVALNVVALVGYGILRAMSSPKASTTVSPTERQTAEKMEASRLMTKEEYLRFRALIDQTKANGGMSDQDLDFVLQTLKRRDANSTRPTYIHLEAAAAISCIKSFKEGQKERAFQASIPLYASSDAYDQRAAIAIAETLKDPAAVPYVLPLLDSPKTNVRDHAKAYLASVGYHAGDKS